MALEASASGANTVRCEEAKPGDWYASQSSTVESASLANFSYEGQSCHQPQGKLLISGTSIDSLQASAREIIKEINAKRKQDTQLLTDFKKAVELQVANMCEVVEQQIFGTYDREGKRIQAKLVEIFGTLDRIGQLESELQQFRKAVQILYQEIQQD